MKYDLEERTAKFGEEIIDFVKTLKENSINSPLIRQIVRSSTSIGANYCEANNASSKKDFMNKIFICKKEIQETKYWMELLARTNLEHKDELRKLWKETHELTLIFNKIIFSLKKKEYEDKNGKN